MRAPTRLMRADMKSAPTDILPAGTRSRFALGFDGSIRRRGAHRASAYFRVQGTRPIVPATDSNVGADFISARSAAAFIRKPAASGKCGPGGHTGRPYGGIEGARRAGPENLVLLQKLLSFSKAPGRNREYNLFATN